MSHVLLCIYVVLPIFKDFLVLKIFFSMLVLSHNFCVYFCEAQMRECVYMK
jgi:hypothetical protein